ncbi:MAG: ester cyclase [Longimicrobiales bacterium]
MAERTWVLALLALAVSCGPSEAPAPDGSAAEELVRELFTVAWNTGDIGGLDPGAAADSVLFHYRGTSSYTTLGELGGLIAHWRTAFPDLRMELLDLVSEPGTVAARVRYSGTHQAEWFGIPATGRQVSVDEMMFFRFENGLLVEAWEVDDQLSMRTQLGLLP